MATTKFVVMSVMLGGLYWMYWYYRQWKAWRQLSGEPVIAWLRALFSIIFVYSLAWCPGWLAVTLIVVQTLSWTISYFMPLTLQEVLVGNVLFIVTIVLLMLRVQRVINRVSGDPQGMGNRRLTWTNALWIVGAGIMVIACLMAIGILVQHVGLESL